MHKPIIDVRDGIARNPAVRFNHPICFTLGSSEHLAIMGPNGSGKTLLVDTLLGKYPLLEGKISYHFPHSPTASVYKNIKYLAFRDTYGSADANYYYQQRWNSTEQDDVPCVSEMLDDYDDNSFSRSLMDMFAVEPLMDKKIILLSSGELRKFQIVKALLTAPQVLILDNPYIGLDAQSRGLLTRLLTQLSEKTNQRIILVLSRFEFVPEFITHVIPVEGKTLHEKITRKQYISFKSPFGEMPAVRNITDRIRSLHFNDDYMVANEIIRLNNVSIRYGDRTILRELSWTIRKGEKWALTGANGSGKSTLLSLIYADNPQSYACDISLFGRKRGTGESIWDIKRHIGYVSPEMHRAYLKNIPAIEIVASGLHDSIGLYKKPLPEQLSVCRWWMEIFGIDRYKDTPFLQLSSGEQRLALLARAFVKDPELLILDEPLHGLDTFNRQLVRSIINAFSQRPGKTLIMVTHYQEELPDSITERLVLNRER